MTDLRLEGSSLERHRLVRQRHNGFSPRVASIQASTRHPDYSSRDPDVTRRVGFDVKQTSCSKTGITPARS